MHPTLSKRSEVWQKLATPTGAAWAGDLFPLEIVSLLNSLHDDDELYLHGTQDMFPTFLQRQWGMGSTPARCHHRHLHGGSHSWRLGLWFFLRPLRTPSRHDHALVSAVALVPLSASRPLSALFVVGAFMIQFMVQGAWGIIPPPLRIVAGLVRGFLPGFAYQCGVLLAGSRIHRGDSRSAYPLRQCHGADRVCSVLARRRGSSSGPRTQGHPIRCLAFCQPANAVIVSAAWTSRSEVSAESKDPCIFRSAKEASGNSPPHWGFTFLRLGGAALQRCGHRFVLNLASAAEGGHVANRKTANPCLSSPVKTCEDCFDFQRSLPHGRAEFFQSHAL